MHRQQNFQKFSDAGILIVTVTHRVGTRVINLVDLTMELCGKKTTPEQFFILTTYFKYGPIISLEK